MGGGSVNKPITSVGDARKAAEDFSYYNPEIMADPHPVYSALRQRCPIAHSDTLGGFWLVSRYADIDTIAHDTTTFSSRHVEIPAGAYGENAPGPPIILDPPEHSRFRRLLQPAFGPSVVGGLEAGTRAQARQLIEQFKGRATCDAGREYAMKIPVKRTSTLLGVPDSDEPKFIDWIHRVVEEGPNNPLDAMAGMEELLEYFRQQIETRVTNPGDDLISCLVHGVVDGDRLDKKEILGSVFLLLAAGIDTTWSMIGSIIWHLAQHEEDRRRLVENPDLLPNALEEFLRYYTPASLARVVTKDTAYEGVEFKEGESVLLLFPSANRDEEAFPDADNVVIDRQVNRHIAFGVGPHRCLGAPIARQELRVAIEEWLAAIPEFWLTEPEAVVWSTGPIWGPRSLPVGFPAR
jgi:hypothetical protein